MFNFLNLTCIIFLRWMWHHPDYFSNLFLSEVAPGQSKMNLSEWKPSTYQETEESQLWHASFCFEILGDPKRSPATGRCSANPDKSKESHGQHDMGMKRYLPHSLADRAPAGYKALWYLIPLTRNFTYRPAWYGYFKSVAEVFSSRHGSALRTYYRTSPSSL